MIYLHKLFPLIFSPLGITLILLFYSFVVGRKWALGLSISLLLIASFPVTANMVWVSLESEYPYSPIQNTPQADAVIVLSGMLTGFKDDTGYVTQWSSPDRLFAGVQLIKLKKVKKLILTRGELPWSEGPPEGEVLMEKALELGIGSHQILLTSKVRNTEEEALAVKRLMDSSDLRTAILVTSSFHMPRANLLFQNAGIKTFPYPTNFKARGFFTSWLDLIPSASALNRTSSGLREYIGRTYYWLKSPR